MPKNKESVRVCLALRDKDAANKDKWELFNMYGLDGLKTGGKSWTSRYKYPVADDDVNTFCNIAVNPTEPNKDVD